MKISGEMMYNLFTQGMQRTYGSYWVETEWGSLSNKMKRVYNLMAQQINERYEEISHFYPQG